MLSSLVPRREPLDMVMMLGLALAAAGLVWTFWPIPDVDSKYFPSVRRAAFGRRGPRVLIDEAHGNTYTAQGHYQPFAHLLSRDGCRISRGTRPFSRPLLQTADVLVVAGPHLNWRRAAFDADELHAVRDWVAAGGALLLIAGPGDAVGALAGEFGFRLITQQAEDPRSFIRLGRDRGVNEHAITRGRAEANEEIKQVMTLACQSVVPPQGAQPFLMLPDSESAQGVALEYAKGRVVVMGDAGALSAQRIQRDGREIRFGINNADFDNQQLALNIIHWLARIL